jgi:nicotinic acid mononucleotide adenylyltransferase
MTFKNKPKTKKNRKNRKNRKNKIRKTKKMTNKSYKKLLRGKRKSRNTISPQSNYITDNIDDIILRLPGKTIGYIYGCYCPPHKGHYKTFIDSIHNLDLDMLFIESGNRKKRPRHGTPLEHSERMLSIFARQLEENTNAKVYIIDKSKSKHNLMNFTWVVPSINTFYWIVYVENESNLGKYNKSLNHFNKSMFTQLRSNPQSNDKFKHVEFLRDDNSTSSTKFSICLEQYIKNQTQENHDKCHPFINHLSPSNINYYLDDILQYNVYKEYGI